MTKINKESLNIRTNILNTNMLNIVAKNLSIFMNKNSNVTPTQNGDNMWGNCGLELTHSNQNLTNSNSYGSVKEIMNNDPSAKMNAAVNNYTPPKSGKKPKSQQELEDKASVYREMLEDPSISSEEKEDYKARLINLPDEGNGEIDRPAKNWTGNCWVMGGINSLASTEIGRQFLNKNITKQTKNGTTLFIVHLQEAENKGFPSSNKQGVYIFTEQEVLAIQNEKGIATGDGDIAAYALAVESYLKDSGSGKDINTGNNPDRMFEILTGLKRSSYGEATGITYAQNSDPVEFAADFKNIHNLVKNQNAAFTLSDGEHTFSVVGTDGDHLLVQESTFDTDKYSKKFELIENSAPPTYRISINDFKNKFISYASLQWE